MNAMNQPTLLKMPLAGLAALCLAAPAMATPAAPYAFALHVTLSPRAAAKLAAEREGVHASAIFAGQPLPSKEKYADDNTGDIELGGEDVEIAGAGLIRITGKGIDPARLAWVKPGTFRINVNVVSSMHRHKLNMINCTLIDGMAQNIVGRTHNVACKLIGE